MTTKYSFLSIRTEQDFQRSVLKLFYSQYKSVPIYRNYIDLLRINPRKVNHIEQIPFLPIQFFRTQEVYRTLSTKPKLVFTSSGTSGAETSRHYVTEPSVYEHALVASFSHFYDDPRRMCILALLPSYLERESSSLVYMANHLITNTKRKESGFYLNNTDELVSKVKELDKLGYRTLLLGVSFALLDLAEHYKLKLKNTIVMETGGMKGRRAEMPREMLHKQLCKAFGVSKIHSEYGMTELLSQAYSKGDGLFRCPPWMRVLVRDITDPMLVQPSGRGGLNIIDLANIYSCAFIQTDDLGMVHPDGSFEVLGRLDNAPTRGCNLLLDS